MICDGLDPDGAPSKTKSALIQYYVSNSDFGVIDDSKASSSGGAASSSGGAGPSASSKASAKGKAKAKAKGKAKAGKVFDAVDQDMDIVKFKDMQDVITGA